MSLFILISDLHFGRNHDSEQANQDTLDFLDFVCDYSRNAGITHCAMLGDYFDRRGSMSVSTENYALRGAQKLIDRFGPDNLTFICGNHDQYYKDSNKTTSLAMFEGKIRLIKDIPYFDFDHNIMYFPWILNPEHYNEMVKLANEFSAQYIFAHLEGRGFKMNNSFFMEHGQDLSKLVHMKHVFSGHYHMRQTTANVTYVGSPMPYNFGDANDNERGFCILDTDTAEYTFVNWDEVYFKSLSYKEVLSDDFKIESPKTSIRVIVDDIVSHEVTEAIQKKLGELEIRGSQIVYNKNAIKDALAQDVEKINDIKDLDTLVLQYLTNMQDVETIDSGLLTSLYKEAVAAGKDE